MDIIKLLKNVNNLDEYISATQEVSSNYINSKVQINITTALTLKKIRSLEIEYLNKYEEKGVACLVFEKLLCLPPSKTWGVLGKELVGLIQYWLDAVRKHLIKHSQYWWTFLRVLLKFIKEIRVKDKWLPNTLVELTTECLLELATCERCDAYQRHEILHSLNVVCAECAREVRLALRNKFGNYFIKLSQSISSCGYFPQQYSSLETLVRWMVPRHDTALRRACARDWFKQYPDKAVHLFMNTNWMNFYQDAREFLNELNSSNGLVTSVVCKNLCIGNINVLAGIEKQTSWLDVNSSNRCVSVLLDPRALRHFGVADQRACETLLIGEQHTNIARLHRDTSVCLTLHMSRAPTALPSDTCLGDHRHMSVIISSHSDIKRLDTALRNVFGDKYQLQFNLDTETTLSPLTSYVQSGKGSEEDPRFSHPVEVRKPRRFGYVSKSRINTSIISPSSASTSSLAQLHERLAALPRFEFDKEPISVCARPQLSNVTELSERDDKSFDSATTLKLRPYGVCHLRVNKERHSQSDSEAKPKQSRAVSPALSDGNNTSCLLIATIGSNESVIKDTVERVSKNKDYNNHNIVDLIVQEALQANNEKVSDSGKNTDDNKKSQESIENSEAIENTPVQELEKNSKSNKTKRKLGKNKKCVVVSKSTTDDESNTEAINETPMFVNTRVTRSRTKSEDVPKQIFDEQAIENFFSQHYNQNKDGQIVVSPTLARKLNETSSETSDNFDDNYLVSNMLNEGDLFHFNDIEIIECLNDIVDKVCNDFDKCTDVFGQNNFNIEMQDQRGTNENNEKLSTERTPQKKNRPIRNIKLKFQSSNKMKTRKTKTKNKLNKVIDNSPKKMSTIIERTDEDTILEPIDVNADKIEVYHSPENKQDLNSTMRRKRKLYSPKDDVFEGEKVIDVQEPNEDHTKLANIKTKAKKTIKSAASSYKDIENERKKFFRNTRNKKSKVESPPSPRTSKMNALFDKVKETVESTENIKIVDKNAYDVYNFDTDSEDEDFKKKTIDVQKKSSTTTLESTKSNRRRRQRGRINYTETKSTDEEAKKTKAYKRKKPSKKTNKRKISANIEQTVDLTDERMRESVRDVLNDSIVIEQPQSTKYDIIEPRITEKIEMEPIEEDMTKRVKKDNNNQYSKALRKAKPKTNNQPKTVSDKEDDRTTSPLPGLEVEVATNKDVINESVTDAMAQKIRKMYHEGHDLNDTTNTQNMVSDIEIHSTTHVNLADEICIIDDNKQNYSESTQLKTRKKIKTEKKSQNKSSVLHENVIGSDNVSERSIASHGITAHGDDNEKPPSPKMIQTKYQPREIEDLEGSTRDFFVQLTKATIGTPNRETKSSDNGEETKCNKSIEKSPVVSVKRLSIDDISRWLPSRRTTETDSSTPATPKAKSVKKSPMKSPDLTISKISLEEFDKWFPMPKTDAEISSPILNNEVTRPAKTRSQRKHKEIKEKRKSKKSTILSVKSIVDSSDENSSLDECTKKVRRLFRQHTKPKRSSYEPVKRTESPTFSKKRRSSPICGSFSKRLKPDVEKVTLSESYPSVSYAQEWVNMTGSKGDVSSQTTDVLNNIMEKLDTTLVEINRNTGKKFVNLFVDMQQQLSDQMEERQKLYKTIVTDVLTNCVDIMNKALGKLIDKSHQMDEQFILKLKKNALDLVREDCKKKQAMVMILKQDVQSVMDHLEKKRRTDFD